MAASVREPKPQLNLAVFGKYVDLEDSYISVREALYHAGIHHHRDVRVDWIPSEAIEGLPKIPFDLGVGQKAEHGLGRLRAVRAPGGARDERRPRRPHPRAVAGRPGGEPPGLSRL
jgi:hypothetical protein